MASTLKDLGTSSFGFTSSLGVASSWISGTMMSLSTHKKVYRKYQITHLDKRINQSFFTSGFPYLGTTIQGVFMVTSWRTSGFSNISVTHFWFLENLHDRHHLGWSHDQIRTSDWLRNEITQSCCNLIGYVPCKCHLLLFPYHKHCVWREIGESETNIFNPKQSIHLTIKVTFGGALTFAHVKYTLLLVFFIPTVTVIPKENVCSFCASII